MNSDAQMEFESMAFPKDRQMLYPHEIAQKLRCTVRHVLDLITEGKLRAINIAGVNATDRRFIRIPIESWEKYVRENTV